MEEESPKFIVELDKYSTMDIETMVMDNHNPEEVGKEYGLEVYEKVSGALSSQLSIATLQTFRVGDLLESLSLRQDIAVDLF